MVKRYRDYDDRRSEMLETLDSLQSKVPEDQRMELVDRRLNLQLDPRGRDVLAKAQSVLSKSEAKMRSLNAALDSYFNRIHLTQEDEACNGFVPGNDGGMPGLQTVKASYGTLETLVSEMDFDHDSRLELLNKFHETDRILLTEKGPKALQKAKSENNTIDIGKVEGILMEVEARDKKTQEEISDVKAGQQSVGQIQAGLRRIQSALACGQMGC